MSCLECVFPDGCVLGVDRRPQWLERPWDLGEGKSCTGCLTNIPIPAVVPSAQLKNCKQLFYSKFLDLDACQEHRVWPPDHEKDGSKSIFVFPCSVVLSWFSQ